MICRAQTDPKSELTEAAATAALPAPKGIP